MTVDPCPVCGTELVESREDISEPGYKLTLVSMSCPNPDCEVSVAYDFAV